MLFNGIFSDIVIKIIPQGYDNCGFILWNDKRDESECVLIDVYDAKAFIIELKSLRKIPAVVLSTHWHWLVVISCMTTKIAYVL